MKIFRFILILLACALLIYNATKLDFDALFTGESLVASITVLAAGCAIILLLILQTSLRIRKKIK